MAVPLPARGKALLDLAAAVTMEPWTVPGSNAVEALRAVGVSEEGVVQAVTISAAFNHLTRVADGTGIEPDYVSPLPRLVVDASRQPQTRSSSECRPLRSRLPLDLRPRTAEAMAGWRAYARSPSAALSDEDRRVVGSAVAEWLTDDEGRHAWKPLSPRGERQLQFLRYAEKLTDAPWRVSERDLEPLRGEGLDDRGLLDLIALVGFQNMDSRVRLILAP